MNRIPCVCFLIVSALLLAQPAMSQAKVAPDGAVGVNAAWEAGKSAQWFIEEQRCGADYIDLGLKREDPNLINQGISIFHWGWTHQAPDGSFPGTGDPFHSVSLFIEAAARATIELKNHKFAFPMAGQAAIYNVVASNIQRIKLSAAWLTRSDIAKQGQQYDSPYTHRRYILGAALSETAYLTGDAGAASAADNYIANGLSLQLGAGWTAAFLPPVNGVTPPAGLVAPAAMRMILSLCSPLPT